MLHIREKISNLAFAMVVQLESLPKCKTSEVLKIHLYLQQAKEAWQESGVWKEIAESDLPDFRELIETCYPVGIPKAYIEAITGDLTDSEYAAWKSRLEHNNALHDKLMDVIDEFLHDHKEE